MFDFFKTTDIIQDTAENDIVDFVCEILAAVNQN